MQLEATSSFWYTLYRSRIPTKGKLLLGDNCIQNFHLGRYNVGYMVGNLVYGDARAKP